MKKIIIILISLFFFCGCSNNKGPEEIVSNYLNSFINLDKSVLNEINNVVDNNEEFNDAHKSMYKKILIRQYQSLKYDILSSDIDDKYAIVKVNVIVHDLNKASKEAQNDLITNLSNFYDEKNVFDNNKYLLTKLEYMEKSKFLTDYDIDFILKKKKGKWILENPTEEDLLKIHGLYEKDS